MYVYYKFQSTLDFNRISIDGHYVSVADLKKAIFEQKRLGNKIKMDLRITNAHTEKEYTQDNALIAQNTYLIVARVPLKLKRNHTTCERTETRTFNNSKDASNLGGSVDFTKIDGSETDETGAMITQITQDYDSSRHMTICGSNQIGEVPPNYCCYKCHQPGHWIQNCPYSASAIRGPVQIEPKEGFESLSTNQWSYHRPDQYQVGGRSVDQSSVGLVNERLNSSSTVHGNYNQYYVGERPAERLPGTNDGYMGHYQDRRKNISVHRRRYSSRRWIATSDLRNMYRYNA